jgi:3-oxoadipate enol-lactonase
MPRIDNCGVKVWYTTAGDRASEALVLLTGALLDHTVWQAQIDHFKDRYYVIAIDNRGCGESDRPEYAYTARMLCEDVELVLYEEGVFQFNLAGFSMGGLVAQKLVERNVEKVLRLVLMNTTLGAAHPGMVPPEQSAANMYLYHSMLTDDDLARNVLDFCFGPDLEEADPGSYAAWFEKIKPWVGAVEYQAGVLLERQPLIARYERVQCPVLAVFAEDDPITRPANAGAVTESFSDARTVTVPGYHMSPVVRADEINQLMEEFLVVETPVSGL